MSGSDSSTKPPSQRRVSEALRAGQLPISHFFNSFSSLFAGCCLAASGAGWAVAFVVAGVRSRIENATSEVPFVHSLGLAWSWGLQAILFIVAPLGALCWGALALAAVLQVRGRFRFPGTTRNSRQSGRLVPVVAVATLVVVALTTLWGCRADLLSAAQKGMHLHAAALLSLFGATSKLLLFRLGATALCLAVVDGFWQWWRWRQGLRMSRAEVDEENRLLHGDPLLLRERQRLGRQ
jgi:flagellar biosynthesis protein FlhB